MPAVHVMDMGTSYKLASLVKSFPGIYSSRLAVWNRLVALVSLGSARLNKIASIAPSLAILAVNMLTQPQLAYFFMNEMSNSTIE